MGLKSFFGNLMGKPPQLPPPVDAAKLPGSASKPIVPAKLPIQQSPVLGYARSWSLLRVKNRNVTLTYQGPVYDLAGIGRLEDVEAYVMQAHLKKIATMFKQGWSFTGRNPDTIAYIQRRLQEIDDAIPDEEEGIEELIIRTGAELIKFSNSFWVKVRDRKASTGKSRTRPDGTRIPPIAAYFGIPPETMRYSFDENGKILGYKQEMPDGRYKEFPKDDVIHFRYNRKSGIEIGTPILIPVKDDIKALREIEENVEILVHQHLFPLFQFIVGTEKAPASMLKVGNEGVDEIAFWKAEIERLPAEGAIVTSERQQIKAIGVEGEAMKVKEYLSYFRERLFGGQGMSGVDFGISDTTNRNTASTMSRALIDTIKLIQKTFEIQFHRRVIKELLRESTFSNALSPENDVRFVFNEIDIDTMIKIMNNAALMYSSHVLSESETRILMGYQALPEDQRMQMYLELVEKPLAQMKLGAQIEVAEAKASLKQKNTPTNQHGTKTGPTKSKNSRDSVSARYDEAYSDVTTRISSGQSFSYIKSALQTHATGAKAGIENIIRDSFSQGIMDSSLPLTIMGEHLNPLVRAADRMVSDSRGDIDRLFDSLIRKIHNHLSVDPRDETKTIGLLFETSKYRARLIDIATARQSYIYGKALGYKYLGHSQVVTVPQLGSSHTKRVIDLERVSLSDLPPFTPNCRCDIGVEE